MAKLNHDPLNYIRYWWMKATIAVVFVFLYAPIVAMVAFSFNDSKRNIIWHGFTFKYYEKAWNNESLFEAFSNSLIIATTSMVFSTILGIMAAVLFWRFKFPCKPLVDGVVNLPIVVPEICMGVAMLAFFNFINWPSDLPHPFNLSNIAIAHITFTFPFVAVIVRARLASLNRDIEDAAKDLGANEWQVFKDILIPQIKPAIIAGALIAFTLSLDDFVITFFTSSPNSITLPVKIFSMVRFSVTPEVNAASTALIVITLVAVLLAALTQRKKS